MLSERQTYSKSSFGERNRKTLTDRDFERDRNRERVRVRNVDSQSEKGKDSRTIEKEGKKQKDTLR